MRYWKESTVFQKKMTAQIFVRNWDVLFQVALHSVIAEEEGLFTVEDVIRDVSSKMKFRHPKIFSPEDKQLAGLSWEELKQLEKATEEEPEKAEKP